MPHSVRNSFNSVSFAAPFDKLDLNGMVFVNQERRFALDATIQTQ